MEQLNLPPGLGSIEILTYLNVTRLALGGPCLLHVIAPRGTLQQTPRGPYAELGNVIHTLIDLAITGQLGNGSVPASAAAAFDYLLEHTTSRLSLDPETKVYADLSVAFSKREWEKRPFYAIADAEKVRGPDRPAPADHKGSRSEPLSLARFLQSGKKATEVPLKSASLRLRGRLDLVDKS